MTFRRLTPSEVCSICQKQKPDIASLRVRFALSLAIDLIWINPQSQRRLDTGVENSSPTREQGMRRWVKIFQFSLFTILGIQVGSI